MKKNIELNDILKEKLKVDDEAKQMAKAFTDAFGSIIKGTSSVEDAITSLLDKIADLIIQITILEPLEKSLRSFFSNSGGISGGGGLISTITSMFGFKDGGAFDAGVQKFAKGSAFTNQVVSSPTLFQMATGTGMMGEAGPEAIMPLSRSSDGSLGVRVTGSQVSHPNVSVVVVNNTTEKAETKETVDSKGNRKIEVMIGDMTAGEVSRSGSAAQKSIKSTFGLNQQLIRR